MAILALGLIFAACGFYGYVLVRFRRDEKLPRRTQEGPQVFRFHHDLFGLTLGGGQINNLL
ncbi:MAG: hypothetical protein WCA38_07955 [Candidatus Acidiferrales bacterium]